MGIGLWLHDVKAPKYVVANDGTGDFNGTDETPIQNALNALTPGRTWKEKIVLKGEFELGDTLIPNDYTEIEICGKLRLKDGVNKPIFTITDKSNIEIYGGELDGNAANQTVAIQGVRIYSDNKSCENIIVRDIFVHDFSGHLIIASSSGTYYNKNIVFYNILGENPGADYGTAIMYYVETGQMSNIRCYGGKYGVEAVYGKNINIENVYSYGLSGDNRFGAAATETPTLENITVTNLVAENCATGIQVGLNVKDIVISNCVIKNPTNYGMWISSSALVENCKIVGGSEGIRLNGNEIKIKGCEIKDSDNYGVRESSGVDYNIIEGNIFRNIPTPIYKVGANTIIRRNIGYVTENSGTATFIGDGTTTSFNIAHGLVSTPNYWSVEEVSSAAGAAEISYATVSSSSITVHFKSAPASSSTVIVSWYAEV